MKSISKKCSVALRYLAPTGQPSYRPTVLPATGRRGFTLMEMLVVIVIIGILVGMVGGAYVSARNHAKRGRAETQLRELCKAWTEYYHTYQSWPHSGNDIPMTYANLEPLLADNNSYNSNNIPFLSINIHPGDTYCDPWLHPYKISFNEGQAPQEAAMRIAVSFPNRERYR